jgi:hypothetical protein
MHINTWMISMLNMVYSVHKNRYIVLHMEHSINILYGKTCSNCNNEFYV